MDGPNLIETKSFTDNRGTLIFANDFDMLPIKRFYTLVHPDTSVIRAWQGHKIEQKWFFVLVGSFNIKLVQPDDWLNPSFDLRIHSFNLSENQPAILHVPNGFVTGFKAATPGSKMMVYSDLTLQESKNDDYRFDASYWGNWH